MLHTIYVSCGLTVSEKNFFIFFFFFLSFVSIISLWELMTPGRGQFGPHGLDWQDLCRGSLNIATY